jgi:DNA-directed RNA polymerase subunit RPC12/RpoP
MAVEEGVECPNCKRVVMPRLWLTGSDFLKYKTTQHLCPYCGVVMYETGGTYKRGPVIATAIVVGLLLVAALIMGLVLLYRPGH